MIEISREDVFIQLLKPKDNLFGIDFDPHENSMEMKKIKNKTMNISSGFKMNDEDEVEEIYNFEDLKNYQEIIEHEEEEEEGEGERKVTAIRNIVKDKIDSNENKLICLDGRKPINGFILSERRENNFLKKKFKNIEIPLNFKPSPKLLFDDDSSSGKIKILSISKRSELLDEKKLPSKPKIEKKSNNFHQELPDIMKSRFVFGTKESTSIQEPISSGLYQIKPEKKEEIIKKKSKRIIFEWYPNRILSKRFDIQHPNLKIDTPKAFYSQRKPKVYDNLNIGAEIDLFDRLNKKDENINQDEEVEEIIRPSIEIFKEIFEPKNDVDVDVDNLNKEDEEEGEDIIIERLEENEDDLFAPTKQIQSIISFTSTSRSTTVDQPSPSLNNVSINSNWNKIKSDFLLDEEEEEERKEIKKIESDFKPVYVPQNKLKIKDSKKEKVDKKVNKEGEKSYKELKKELSKLKKQLKKK